MMVNDNGNNEVHINFDCAKRNVPADHKICKILTFMIIPFSKPFF